MRTGIVCGIGKLDIIPRTIIHDVVAQPVAPRLMDEETRLATESHIIRPLCIGRPPRFVTCGLISNPFQIGSYIFRHHVFRTPRLIENKIPAGFQQFFIESECLLSIFLNLFCVIVFCCGKHLLL